MSETSNWKLGCAEVMCSWQPRDGFLRDIEAGVASLAVQIAGERQRHPPRAAADVEHRFVRLQPTQVDQIPDEFSTDFLVGAADELSQGFWRQRLGGATVG